jgi:hypothetical protein
MTVQILKGDCREVLRTLPAESVHCVVTSEQAAYLAGMIDGEGSIECQRQTHGAGTSPRYVIRLSFVMASEEPLQTIGRWIGREPKCYPARDATRQPRWRLHIPKGTLVPLLRACRPYLILKGGQADAVLEIEQIRAKYSPAWCGDGMPDAAVRQMEIVYQRLRSLKSNKRPVACR